MESPIVRSDYLPVRVWYCGGYIPGPSQATCAHYTRREARMCRRARRADLTNVPCEAPISDGGPELDPFDGREEA